MYSSALLFIWAAVLSHLSSWTVGIGVVVTIIGTLRIVFEERFLRDRYPEYAAYARVTKAVVPYVI
jgi:protein-S-isoprenylcysteine O-methyltransferase Ste14